MKTYLRNLKTLVIMQLRDKLDFSFIRSVRSTIIKVVLAIIKLVVAVAIFYVLFMVCNMLSIFRPAGIIPDSVVNILFTIIQLLSIVTATVGLTKTLYMTEDNKVLLTLPVSSTCVYISKLILYYIFELKKNIGLTLPIFIAYGIINGAVWYYYPWLLFCFLFVSMVPVAIAAIISIPALYVGVFVGRFKWLQAILALAGASAVTYLLIRVIGLIPNNINILGQWGSIFVAIQDFLTKFSTYSYPYYRLTTMMVGGTLLISSNLFVGATFATFGVLFGGLAVLLGASFLCARPMFIRMASKQFEFDKRTVKAKSNHVYKRKLSPFVESLQMNLRSTTYIVSCFVQLVLPAIAILLQNRLYAAMNTNYSGYKMTKTFSLLVMLVMTLAFNNAYASVYSKEGAARNILKTRPQKPIYTLFGRIALRAIIVFFSTLLVAVAYIEALSYNYDAQQDLVVYQALDSGSLNEIVMMCLITLLVGEGHLLWCAEMDVMHNFADQYQTVGVQFDSPNERNATLVGFLLSALFAGMYFLLSDIGGLVISSLTPTMAALVKAMAVAVAFLAARIYLYLTRCKMYFVED